jgi:tripartite ATP-independent transporter DctP family solute receptor
MNRRQLLQIGLGAGIATISPPLRATEVLTATDVHPSNYPTVEAVRWMGQQLATETAGEWDIRLYHSGQLGRESDAISLARHAALDMVRVYSGALNNGFPLTRALCLPYLFESTAHVRAVLDGDIGHQVLEGFAQRGLVGLAIFDSGARCFYNTVRPIHTPDDLRGLKFRVPPSDIFLDLLRGFGANPTPLAYGAVYSALETRLIDGAENNVRSFHSSRHFETAPYWSLSRHSYAPDMLLMSKRRFDAMSADLQQRIRKLAAQSVAVMRRLWDESEASAAQALRAAGVASNVVDTARFRAAAAPLLARYEADPTLAPMIERIRQQARA